VLQTGKRDIDITAIAPVGNYAVQPRFSDGHESGIFTWEYLRHLGADQEALWRDYEARLAAAGRDRDTPCPRWARPGAAHDVSRQAAALSGRPQVNRCCAAPPRCR
jgi:hypothetical protein